MWKALAETLPSPPTDRQPNRSADHGAAWSPAHEHTQTGQSITPRIPPGSANWQRVCRIIQLAYINLLAPITVERGCRGTPSSCRGLRGSAPKCPQLTSLPRALPQAACIGHLNSHLLILIILLFLA